MCGGGGEEGARPVEEGGRELGAHCGGLLGWVGLCCVCWFVGGLGLEFGAILRVQLVGFCYAWSAGVLRGSRSWFKLPSGYGKKLIRRAVGTFGAIVIGSG